MTPKLKQPSPGKTLLITHADSKGNKYTCLGVWIEAFTVEADGEFSLWHNRCKLTDKEYLPAGYYDTDCYGQHSATALDNVLEWQYLDEPRKVTLPDFINLVDADAVEQLSSQFVGWLHANGLTL